MFSISLRYKLDYGPCFSFDTVMNGAQVILVSMQAHCCSLLLEQSYLYFLFCLCSQGRFHLVMQINNINPCSDSWQFYRWPQHWTEKIKALSQSTAASVCTFSFPSHIPNIGKGIVNKSHLKYCFSVKGSTLYIC